ncbi:hypothetical protein Mapa_015505 [Marchantia paleacea]|nr:hypothetical protein Mapa_015505 [Marchantia paleacea]
MIAFDEPTVGTLPGVAHDRPLGEPGTGRLMSITIANCSEEKFPSKSCSSVQVEFLQYLL